MGAGRKIRQIIAEAYLGEFGVAADDQPILSVLYLIGHDKPEPFRIFGESDERWRARGGNQTFIEGLSERLGASRIWRGFELVKAARGSTGQVELTFDTSAGTKTETCDYVIFALPFTVLRDIDTAGMGWSEHLTKGGKGPTKATVIRELGYGLNAKLMTAYRRRFWLDGHGSAASITTDNGLGVVWDTSRAQAGQTGVLTHFSSGNAAIAVCLGPAEERARENLRKLEQILPGATATYLPGKALRMDWPSYRYVKGSYSAYRLGQWAFSGAEAEPTPSASFCGEHTSVDFQGWMEGGAESGARAASEALSQLGMPVHPALSNILSISERRRMARLRARSAAGAAMASR